MTTKKKEPLATKPVLPSAFTLFQPSIDTLRINSGGIIGLMLTPILASIPFFVALIVVAALMAGTGTVSNEPSAGLAAFGGLLLVFYVLMIAFCVLVTAGLTIATLKATQGEKINYGDSLRAGRHYFWRYLGLSLLIGLAVLGGLILLVVPGLFMLKRYLLAPYYMIDRDLGISAAMRTSAAESKKVGGVWGLLGVLLLIELLAIIPIVGWIASFIVSILYVCAITIRYQQITEAAALHDNR